MKKQLLLSLLVLILVSGCSTPWFEVTFKDGENKEVKAEQEQVEKQVEKEETSDETKEEECSNAEDCEKEALEEAETEELTFDNTLKNYLGDVETGFDNGKIAFIADPINNYESLQDFYLVEANIGVVKTGTYEGYILKNAFVEGLGSSFNANLFLFNPITKDRLFIEKYIGDKDMDTVKELISEHKTINDFAIDELDTPSTIYIEKYDISVNSGPLLYTQYPDGWDIFESINTPFGDFYKDGSILSKPLKGNFYKEYTYDAGKFWEGPNNLKNLTGQNVSLDNEYSVFSGGCGWFGEGYYTINTSDLDLGNLVLIGTNNDLNYYKPIDVEDEYINDDGYERRLVGEVWSTFKFRNPDRSLSFDEFVEMNPVLFWKDPMGNFASLVRSDMIPAAECGKPVVYLYPEVPMDVSVAVDIEEFTVTIPEHGKDGWTVLAYPDGEIYNYADKESYEYLFWEGFTEDAVTTRGGFAVPKDELDIFFNEKLAELGLNAKEISDFKEFWVPVMKADLNDWFFVTFVGTSEFNKVAPLDITPAPDTLARVFMYYEGRPSEFKVLPQKLRGFEREGFTVVEWGGTTNKDWK